MKTKIKFGFIALMAIIMFSSMRSCSKVPAGHKGIKVYLLGGDKGVDHEELGVGRYWIGINEELYLYPTFTQNEVWTADTQEGSEVDESITFQTTEGLSVNGDFGLTYRVDPEKVPILFETFRRGIDEVTDIFLRNMVRDALNKRSSTIPVEAAYGVGKSALIDSVQSDVQRQVLTKGIIIEKVYSIGEFRLPASVKKALDNKIAATQKAQQRENELRQAEAEAKKKVAEAQGQAESNRVLISSITPALVEWEKLQIRKIEMEKWDGKYPSTLVNGQGTGMLLNLK